MTPDDVVLREGAFLLVRVPRNAGGAVLARLATLVTADSLSAAPGTGRFASAIVEEDGLSLVLDERAVAEFGDLLAGADKEAERYRVLTFLPPLPWTVVGFLARVTARLAAEGIPLGALSAHLRDHLFVRADLAERALEVLRRACAEGRLLAPDGGPA